MNYKDTKPYISAFLSVDLLTDFAAFCLTDIDWRYIHSYVLPLCGEYICIKTLDKNKKNGEYLQDLLRL
jgi:hypothetical protein